MLTIVEMLNMDPEPLPEWLHRCPSRFSRSDFFGSRTVYYPGSGNDGQPVSLCARSHAAHTFIYVDYSMRINNPESVFLGYDVEYTEELGEADLGEPCGWMNVKPEYDLKPIEPFASFVVLHRQAKKHGSHGPIRLAILFVGADGFDTFDALYCQNNSTPAPFLIVAHDHGFGGNYDHFGQDGLLQTLAESHNREPKWLLVGVGNNTTPWVNYDDAGADEILGGSNNTSRSLYIRTPL